MNLIYKLGVALIGGSLLVSTLAVSTASETDTKSITLKEVMQGLLTDTQLITEGIFLEDFPVIEKAAKHIAEHPKAPMTIRVKLAKAFGSEMLQFKSLDGKVHDTAVTINQAAKNKDMKTIISIYHQ